MRVRFRFTKLGKIRFLGHRDLARCWERAVRRANLPVAYSEGFSPRPKLHYGLALPTGAESLAEYVDIDLSAVVDVEGLDKLIGDGLPVGVEVVSVAEVASNAVALQAAVDSCTWEIELGDLATDELRLAVDNLLERADVPLTFERKAKSVTENVRPAILALDVRDTPDDGVVLVADLATKPRSIRPTELLACLDAGGTVRRVCRIEQWMTIEGRPVPPLALVDPSRPGATEDAPLVP